MSRNSSLYMLTVIQSKQKILRREFMTSAVYITCQCSYYSSVNFSPPKNYNHISQLKTPIADSNYYIWYLFKKNYLYSHYLKPESVIILAADLRYPGGRGELRMEVEQRISTLSLQTYHMFVRIASGLARPPWAILRFWLAFWACLWASERPPHFNTLKFIIYERY